MATRPISSPALPDGAAPRPNEAILELLKEAGLCIRTSWILINNLVRSFLYLNLILFTIFGVSLRGFDIGVDLSSSRAADQSQNVSTDDVKQSTPAPSHGKENENFGTQRAEIIKILSFLVCGLGILGPFFALFLLISMINYGRNFLIAANKLEASIFAASGLDQKEIGFYGVMSQRYEASLSKWSSVKITAPAIFLLFAFAWVVLLLHAFNIRYFYYLFKWG
jgi:hypothetical protein